MGVVVCDLERKHVCLKEGFGGFSSCFLVLSI